MIMVFFGEKILKTAFRFIAVWATLFSLVLTACVSGGGNKSANLSQQGTCVEGVCAKITITEPIVLYQPSDVTITMSSSVHRTGMRVALQASPSNVAFGPDSSWYYDAVLTLFLRKQSGFLFISANRGHFYSGNGHILRFLVRQRVSSGNCF